MLRIHASYHKCLTMYFINVMNKSFNSRILFKRNYKFRHFESLKEKFYNKNNKYRIASTNGFAVDIDKLNEDFRITRFIRDPRDLIISGYFYHKRGAEPWFRMKNPSNKYWSPINGNFPIGMEGKLDYSFADYLSELDVEEGLLAEMEFRKFHLESMRLWKEDSRIKLFKYEDIVNNEVETFDAMADHFELSTSEKRKVTKYAQQFSLRNQDGNRHVRNPKPEQWKEHFTDKVNEVFNAEYNDLLEMYGYSK